MKNQNNYIKELIAEGEHQQLDFKFEISDSRKIAKTLSAFANTNGGRLLIGVKDNGAIAGVRSEEEYYMLEGAATLYSKPMIEFKPVKWGVEGKTVLEIIVPAGTDKPYFAQDSEGKWYAYVRVNDQNILANSVQVKVWKRQHQPKGTFVRYSNKESILLEFLEEHEFITLGKFMKIASINHKLAETILVNLICIDIIDIEISEKQAVYTLKKNDSVYKF